MRRNGDGVLRALTYYGGAFTTTVGVPARGLAGTLTREEHMHRMLRRTIAAAVGAAMLTAPATALADARPGQKFCPTFKQVESDATGGQYVGGILIYETMGSVTRTSGAESTSVSTTSGGEAGVPEVMSSSTSTTVTITSTDPGSSVTADEPIGYYQMNDGSVYQINCVTGEANKVG